MVVQQSIDSFQKSNFSSHKSPVPVQIEDENPADSFAEGSEKSDNEEEMPILDGFRNDNIPNPQKPAQPTEAEQQMRVTWTELARRNTKFGRELTSGQGKRKEKEIDEEMLAKQRQANLKYEQTSDEDDEERAFIPVPGDKDAPTEIKTNLNRRKTMMRRQLIESESHEQLLRPNALSTSDNPSQGKLDDVEDT